MKDPVYQQEMEIPDALLSRILHAATSVDNPNELIRDTCSIHRHAGRVPEAEDGYFEHLSYIQY